MASDPQDNKKQVPKEARMEIILSVLLAVWKQNPELRLGQLLVNIDTQSDVPDLFYLTDEKFLQVLEMIYQQGLQKNRDGT